MTLPRALLLAVAIATGANLHPAGAQTAADLVDQGVRAYGDLEFDAAAAFLRRALSAEAGESIEPNHQARALTYLAAAEFYRGNPDSTEVIFRRLVLFDTRQRPDELVFPPEITNIFDSVRRETKALTAVVPDQSEVNVGAGRFSFVLYASSFLGAVVEITRREDGAQVRLLYDGPVNDSLTVFWDGLDSARTRPEDGSYVLTVTARRPGGGSLRSHQFPMELRATLRDTLPHPVQPADSLLLPERVTAGRSVEALLGGTLMGAAVMVLPAALSSEAELAGTRFVVGSAVTVAGLAGFVARRPGRALPENVAANEALLHQWRDSLGVVISENRQRIDDVRLSIEIGAPAVVER